MSAVACANKPSHISVHFVTRTVKNGANARICMKNKNSNWKKNSSNRNNHVDFGLFFVIWRKKSGANLLPTWLSCLAWKVSNLPVKNRQLNYWKDVIIWIIRKIRGKNVDSNEKIICAEAVVINWANFSYVLKKFDDIVLEHRNLTRFRKRVKIDSTVEVVQRFDFVHNFV